MAYIGNIPAEAYTNTVKDSFNGTGSATAFTLSQPTVTNDVRVVVENVVQDPTVAYSVSGTTLTFTSAPPSGTANIYVVHLGAAVMTAIPPSEIADATTFASSVTVQGAFTSLGIDDNATSTAMTLDGSGNLLVGKTTPALATAGTAIRGDNPGLVNSARAGTVLELNRLSTDGAIQELYKDGATVGIIGSISSDLVVGKSSACLRFDGDNEFIYPATTTANFDARVKLGSSSSRFKDLYLSGGVFLGGTGAANKLDDVESGTFTPNLIGTGGAFSSATYGTQAGAYTKIGNTVTIHVNLAASAVNGGSGALAVGNLPFTVVGACGASVGYISGLNYDGTVYNQIGLYVGNSGGTRLIFTRSGDNAAAQEVTIGEFTASFNVVFSCTYKI